MNLEIYFEFDTNRRTRGYSLKLKKKRFNTELRHFFTDRIINLWNSLDEQIVSSTSLNCFKNGLGTTAEATQTDGSCTCTVMFWLLISWGWASPPSAEASTWRVTWWVWLLVRLLRYSYFTILFIILFFVINSFIRDLSSRRLSDTLHPVCLSVTCLPSNSRKKRSRKKTQH